MVVIDDVPLLLKLTKKGFPYPLGSLRIKTLYGIEIGWIVPDGQFTYQAYARGWKPLLEEPSSRETALRALLSRRKALEEARKFHHPERYYKTIFRRGELVTA